MTLIDALVPIGFATLGGGLGYVVAALRYSAPELDVETMQADLDRWKACGRKEQERANRLAEDVSRLLRGIRDLECLARDLPMMTLPPATIDQTANPEDAA